MLTPGADADLVIVDNMEREHTLTDEGLQTKCGCTLYVGWTVQGIVELTMLRGAVIAKDRRVLGKAGLGEYIAGVAQ